MKRWRGRSAILSLLLFGLLVMYPLRCPAPLIYRPGQGWIYQRVGGGTWVRNRAKDQLQVAQQAFDKKDYALTLKAARRTVHVWPLSDYAPQAQYLVGRSYEERGQDEKAFKQYSILLEKYPKAANFDEVIERQFHIANLYLGGKWFRLFGLIPLYPSMDKTVEMYDKILKEGPYSKVAPQAEMNIGAAREKQSDYVKAVKAYETAADRYHGVPKVGADAMYKEGLAYEKQARSAEYDQNVATKAIGTFTDFMALYPSDPRADKAQSIITRLKTEQAHGSFEIARFYEHKKQLRGALIYYNDVVLLSPHSKYADQAKHRIELLQHRLAQETALR